jgi:Trypsin-co-occurring domain 2
VAVNKEAATGAKVRFWVVEAGADGKIGAITTQKIKLTLDPHRASQPGVQPDVSSAETIGER